MKREGKGRMDEEGGRMKREGGRGEMGVRRDGGGG